MRPIVKKKPGENVEFSNSRGVVDVYVIQENYDTYGDAKLPLVGNIDRYCSYCESLLEIDALEVEHRVARSNGGSETKWDNLLLCCKVCNTIKSTKVVNDNTHWPHLDNTYHDFVYKEDGRVIVNPTLQGLSKEKAENLYNLVGLGQDNTNATPKDFRWQRRYEVWNKANKARKSYEDGKWDVDDVIEKAKDNGHWSIWFTAFKDHEDVLSRLISDFKGTCSSCFNADEHFISLERESSDEDNSL